MTWAIVPLKSPETAKSRLASVLSPGERRALFFELAAGVITALRATPGIDRVAVVTASEEVAAFARGFDVNLIRQPTDSGTADAFGFAIDSLRPQRLERALMIAGDLPLITPQALAVLLGAAEQHRVVIVPDRQGIGTNALLCSPPEAIAPCFGVDSFARHLAAAQALHLSSCTLKLDALALDIDVAADLSHLHRLQAESRAHPPMSERCLAVS